MSHGSVLNLFIGELKQEITDKQVGLSNVSFTSLYQAGTLQGEIRGLQKAIEILERTLEEADN